MAFSIEHLPDIIIKFTHNQCHCTQNEEILNGKSRTLGSELASIKFCLIII